MSIVTGDALTLAYGAQDIFDHLNFRIEGGDHIGLVGANGAGKTSLLRLLAGLERPTGGRLGKARSLNLAYVPQLPEPVSGSTVYQEVAAVFAPLRQLEDALLQAAEDLAAAGEDSAAASARYEELSHRFEHEGGYTYEAEIRRTLQGLGVMPDLWLQPVDGLSGGERARVALAKAILEKPDLLLLDEPTNHLDLQGLGWLENLLRTWQGAFIVVSHDRFFLDQVTNRIWEVAGGGIDAYSGSYSAFERQRRERRERLEVEYAQQRELIAKQEELIRRYEKGQRAKWAKGLEKRLSHIERIEAPVEAATAKLDLGRVQRSGRVALALEGLVIAHPGDPTRTLLRLPERLEVERGARVAIMGPNGSGKTTLLRTISSEATPPEGKVRLGYNVQLAYYRQGTEHLDDTSTVLEELLASRNLPIPEARNLLARFLFRGDEIDKRVGMLSGGERSRIALAKLSVSGANLLLLDEPTNHLDIASREALEQVLTGYEGTVLFVSHDRRFIDALAGELWTVADGLLTAFHGNYSESLAAARQQAVAEVAPSPAPAQTISERRRRPPVHELSRLEENVAGLETLLADVSTQLEAASARRDAAEVAKLGQIYVETEKALDQALHAWEEASA